MSINGASHTKQYLPFFSVWLSMLLQHKLVLISEQKHKSKYTLLEKCPYSEFFWSVFSRISTEYGKMQTISRYSVQMRDTDQKNTEYQHFSRSDTKYNDHKNARTNGSFEALLRRFS